MGALRYDVSYDRSSIMRIPFRYAFFRPPNVTYCMNRDGLYDRITLPLTLLRLLYPTKQLCLFYKRCPECAHDS
jgi:hypothetical protein